MAFIPMARSKYLLPVVNFLEQLGSPVGKFAGLSRLPLDRLYEPEALIPVTRAFEFMAISSRAEFVPGLAAVAYSDLDLRALANEFGNYLLQAPTLAGMLDRFSQNLGHESSNVGILLERSPDTIFLSLERRTPRGKTVWHEDLFTLALCSIFTRSVEPSWSPSLAHVSSNMTIPRRRLLNRLGYGDVKFGRTHAGIEIPMSLAAMPIGEGPEKHAASKLELRSQPPAITMATSVQQVAESYGVKSLPRIKDIADVAGCSVRKLEYELAAEGLTYKQIVLKTRMEFAVSLLETSNASLEAIAFETGYSNHTNFSRAFRKWSGLAPSEFRRLRGDSL